MTETNLLLAGYRMTTAEITYHMPDHPDLLQTFVWQDLDLAPEFPILRQFLEFWRDNLEGELHSVVIGSSDRIAPSEFSAPHVSLSVH